MEGIITKVSKVYLDGRPQILTCVEEGRAVGVLFRYQRTHKAELNDSYRVYGQCFNLSNNKILPISESYDTLDEAKQYFDQLIKDFPQSHIHIYRQLIQDIESYV